MKCYNRFVVSMNGINLRRRFRDVPSKEADFALLFTLGGHWQCVIDKAIGSECQAIDVGGRARESDAAVWSDRESECSDQVFVGARCHKNDLWVNAYQRLTADEYWDGVSVRPVAAEQASRSAEGRAA